MADKADYKQIAKKVIEVVGEDNIISATHCATRLRLQVKDRKAIDDEKVEGIDQVKGVFYNAGQYQIIFGTGTVNKVYLEFSQLLEYDETSKEEMENEDSSKLQKFIRDIADIFVPIIPILGATGLFLGLKGVLFNDTVLSVLGMNSDIISEWINTITTVLTDTAFGFLAAFICWSAFKKMGGLPIIGFLIGLMLVSPALPNAYAVAEGSASPIMAFGFIPLVGYQGSILTALITGIIGAKLEKKLRKVMPNFMDLIFTPFVVILVSVFIALFILGPLVHAFESQAVKAIELFLHLPLGLGGLIIGFLYPIAVMTGMHHMFIMIETSLLASTGYNPLITVCAMYGFANAAVCLAIALRTKRTSVKTAGVSATATQLLGVSEPALFGVVMRTGIKAIGVMLVSSAIGGMALSLLGIQANSYGLAVLLSPLMYIYDSYQVITYIAVSIATFIVAFILTNAFVIDRKEEEERKNKVLSIGAPISGRIIPLKEVNDEVFSKEIVGQGLAIIPDSNTIYSPIDGVVEVTYASNHAFGFKSDDGIEVLVHIGLDTVKPNGEGFKSFWEQGDRIQRYDKICEFDRELIKSKGYDDTVMVIVTNTDKFDSITSVSNSIVTSEDEILQIR